MKVQVAMELLRIVELNYYIKKEFRVEGSI